MGSCDATRFQNTINRKPYEEDCNANCAASRKRVLPRGSHDCLAARTVAFSATRSIGAYKLPLRPHHLAGSPGELPLPRDHHGRHAQRPGRPRRQHPHAQEHRRQVHRTQPLPLGRRSQPAAAISSAPKQQTPQGPRRRSGHDSAGLHLRDRHHAGRTRSPSRTGPLPPWASPSRNAISAMPTCSIPDGASKTTGGRANPSPT